LLIQKSLDFGEKLWRRRRVIGSRKIGFHSLG
jgi:hypothetical protein